MDKSKSVLIVGAGPTGLTMACCLLRHQIPFRIIDKKPGPTTTSNALGIQARTLELLEDLGLVERFLARGCRMHHVDMHYHNKVLAHLSFDSIDTHYPFALFLPQSVTEQLLIEHLASHGVIVERQCQLTDLKEKEGSLDITLNNNGQPETLSSEWLIACDGAHSKVRELAHMAFEGHDIPQQFILADIIAETPSSHDQLNTFIHKQGLLAAFPLPDHQAWRVIMNTKDSITGTPDEHKTIDTIQTRSQEFYQVQKVTWLSSFWIHSKVIHRMQHNHIFFAGDTAHIHSPMGGQGMNTGMQDAYNLAWKLALVINHNADKKLLTSYHEERYPVVQGVVKSTDKMTKLMLIHNPLLVSLRNFVIKHLTNKKSVNRKIATRLAQLGVHYKKSPIINYQSVISSRSPQPGQRLPEVDIDHNRRLTTLCHGPQFHLLIFSGLSPTQQDRHQIDRIVNHINQHYADIIASTIITTTPMTQLLHQQVSDPKFNIHRRFNVTQPALCLVRPDNYISFCSAKLDLSLLQQNLESKLSLANQLSTNHE